MSVEIDKTLATCKKQLRSVAAYSAVVNLLMLNSSIYMLQVYDRVLVSRSLQTLAVLTIVLIFVFVAQGVIDGLRQRLLVRVGLVFDLDLREKARAATLRRAVRGLSPSAALQPLRDIDQIRTFLTGAGPSALLDLPWAPIFLAIVFAIHPWMGTLALAGGALLVVFTILAERRGRDTAKNILSLGTKGALRSEVDRRNAEGILAMGLEPALHDRANAESNEMASAIKQNQDVVGGYSAASRILRLLLQSLILGLGAFLVVRNEISGGAIFACSIVVGRALSPIDMVIANWRAFLQSRESLDRLRGALTEVEDAPDLQLPPPAKQLSVEGLTVVAPGGKELVVAGVSFTLGAGDILGVVGPSGAGKSSLARALIGIWRPKDGAVRLDGATLDQWGYARLGPHIGYVPQTVNLFEGTIAENIARMEMNPAPEKVLSAAKAAGVHDLIVRLPNGYDTTIGDIGGPLSIGQRQRIALARAFYGDPFLIILDEANANLDTAGEAALHQAIREAQRRGAIVVLISHRQSILSLCTKIMVLQDGRIRTFGPASEILRPRNAIPQSKPNLASAHP
jgi:ATP-binding cassette subfamily C protein